MPIRFWLVLAAGRATPPLAPMFGHRHPSRRPAAASPVAQSQEFQSWDTGVLHAGWVCDSRRTRRHGRERERIIVGGFELGVIGKHDLPFMREVLRRTLMVQVVRGYKRPRAIRRYGLKQVLLSRHPCVWI